MKRVILLAIGGLVLLSLCGVGALIALNRAQSNLDIHSVPVYPGATNVQIQDMNNSSSKSQSVWIGSSQSGSQSPGSIVSQMMPRNSSRAGNLEFTTKDNPQQVYAFYDKLYTNGGWSLLAQLGAGSLSGSTSSSSNAMVPSIHQYYYTSASWLHFLPLGHLRKFAIISVEADQLLAGTDTTVSIFLFGN